jgi:hypothetical protein
MRNFIWGVAVGVGVTALAVGTVIWSVMSGELGDLKDHFTGKDKKKPKDEDKS